MSDRALPPANYPKPCFPCKETAGVVITTEPEETTMKGRSPIVLAIDVENFHEHPDLDSAEREAARLVMRKGVVAAVVYVPKRIIRANVVTEHIRGNGRPESKDAPVLKPSLVREVRSSDELVF